MHCTSIGDRKYVVGLAFDDAPADPPPKERTHIPVANDDVFVDHYEALQVNPKADVETIRRVFHILALRYHPDNLETGNVELFSQILEANRALTDPHRRAAHDAQRAQRNQTRFRIFENWESSRGKESERRKRSGILSVLYAKRQAEPERPALTSRELEDLLECPREHLEFPLWFLREKKWVLRSDNNRFEITILGVEAAELHEEPSLVLVRPQLPAPSTP